MNRRSSGLSISKAFAGFEHLEAAERLSPNTLRNYRQHLKLWLSYVGDAAIDQATTQGIRAFLAWSRAG
jgi:site-specific recombinase XerD